MDHETKTLLLELAKIALGFGTAIVPVATVAMRRRGKQNTKLADRLAKEVVYIRTEVLKVAGEVRKVTESQEKTQVLTAIHTDKLNDTNARIASLTIQMDELKETVIKGEDLIEKFNNNLERAKAGTLKEKPLTEGMTAIKKED